MDNTASSEGIDKTRVCFSQREHLSKEHFIDLIGKQVQDCEAWERKLRYQGNLKDAEKMRKTKTQMVKTLEGLQNVNYSRRNK
jgi:phosphate-selective porin